MAGLFGIDISNNNPHVDMAGARAVGVDFVVAKCSQGWIGGPGGWQDWTFVDIINRARAAGIPVVGGYHWMLRSNGAAQARNFVASLARVGGPHGLLCAADIEATSWTPGVTYDPRLCVDPQTIDDFLAEWDRLTAGQPILLYGAGWYHDDYMHAGARWADRPCWPAQYTGTPPNVPAQAALSVTPGFMRPFGGWSSYSVRQFTDNVVVPAQGGGSMQVDGNVSYMPLAQLKAMTEPSGPVHIGEPIMTATLDQVLATQQQLVPVVQGIPKGQPNPYGIVGLKDLAGLLMAMARDAAERDAAHTQQIAALRDQLTAIKLELDAIKTPLVGA